MPEREQLMLQPVVYFSFFVIGMLLRFMCASRFGEKHLQLYPHFNTPLIDPRELRAAMQSLGFEAKNQTIYQMITDLDKNKNNSIDFEEFLDMMTARMSDRDTREDINKVFRLFDDDGTGTVTIRNLRRVARELGETMTDEELQEMIDRADSNGDSAVTPDDFYNIMTKKTFV